MSKRGITSIMEQQILKLGQLNKSIRAIAKALNVSRNTVRKVLRESAQRPVDQKTSQLNGFVDGIPWEEVRKKNAQGITAKQLHSEYAPSSLSYWAFNRRLRRLAPRSKPIAIPMNHTPGHSAQIDYADGIAIVDRATGQATKTQLFCGVLPFSSYTFAEFTTDQKLPSFTRSQERMFHYFGGVPEYVVHDNLKSATTKAHRYDPDRNLSYVDFANHYGFATLPARPRAPRDKGAVEAAIGAIQRSFYQQVHEQTFYSLEELNTAFTAFLKDFNAGSMKDYGASRLERLQTERPVLRPVAAEVFEFSEWREAKVHPDCCLQVDKCFYSVPYTHSGRQLRVKLTARQVQIYTEDLESIVTHARLSEPHSKSIIDDHYPAEKVAASRFEVHAVRQQASRIGPKMEAYAASQLEGPHPLKHLRRVQGVVALAKQAGMTYEALEYAASQALTFGNPRLAYIKDCALHFLQSKRKRSEKAPERSADTLYLHSKGD